MSLKDKINLTTDMGTNVLAVLTPVLTYVLSLPEGTFKKAVIVLIVLAISVDLYLIRGSKAQATPPVDVQATMKEVLQEGRE